MVSVMMMVVMTMLIGIYLTKGSDISSEKAKTKPHIVLIVADDLGWNDVSWHNPEVVTPHLEALALGGVILNRSYVLPICTPTRSALLTGRYPFTIGRQRSTLRPSEPTGLTLNATLLPQALKKVGYSTHAVGKWHLGYCSWLYTPTYRGFDTFYGYYNGAEDYFTHLRSNIREYSCEDCPSSSKQLDDELFGLDLRNNTIPDPNKEGIYSSYLFASYVEDLLESRNPKDPMFLYLPFQSVHAPLMVPANYTKPFRHIHDFNRRTYLGMVSALDEAVGRVVQALKTTGHYNNTVIVFTTDNGGTCHHGGNNWPLRGMKTTLWEGGTRGVGFVHSPLLPNPGTVSNKLLHATDWFQTLVGLGGGMAPTDTDGFNQWEAITSSSPSPRRRMVYNIDQTEKLRAGVRIGNYKLLVGNPGEGDWTPPPKLLKKEKEEVEDEEEEIDVTLKPPTNEPRPGFPDQHQTRNTVFPDNLSNTSHDVNKTETKSNQFNLNGTVSDMSDAPSNARDIQSSGHRAEDNRNDEAKDKKMEHYKQFILSKSRHEGPFVMNAYVPRRHESTPRGKLSNGVISYMKREAFFIDKSPLVIDSSEVATATYIENGQADETTHKPNVNRVSEQKNVTRHPVEVSGKENLIGSFPGESNQLEPLVRGANSPLLNSIDTNPINSDDGVTWEHLLKNYLVNDAWLDQLPRQVNFLKNKTLIRLYNVKKDPEERNNLATRKIHRVKVLLEFLLGEIMNRYVPADIKPEVPRANPKNWNNTWSPGWCHP